MLDNEIDLQIKKLHANGEIQKAASLLVDKYYARLYRYLKTILLSDEDALDVLQEVCIKAFQNLNNFKYESKLYSWLYRIAYNEAINHLNKNKKHLVHTDINDVPNSLKTMHIEQLESEKIEALLAQALETLPVKQREVFYFRYFDDLSFEEISKITNTSIGGLKANYHHANQKIQDFLRYKIN